MLVIPNICPWMFFKFFLCEIFGVQVRIILCAWFPLHHHYLLFLQFLQIILPCSHVPSLDSHTKSFTKSTAPWLYNSNTIGSATFRTNNSSNLFRYIISCALLVAAINSASVLEEATIFCIMLFWMMGAHTRMYWYHWFFLLFLDPLHNLNQTVLGRVIQNLGHNHNYGLVPTPIHFLFYPNNTPSLFSWLWFAPVKFLLTWILIIHQQYCKSLGVHCIMCSNFQHHFESWSCLPHLEIPVHFVPVLILILPVSSPCFQRKTLR